MRQGLVVAGTVLLGILLTRELALSLPILGVGPDVLLLTLLAVSGGERPTTAATYGFGIGLVRDLLLATPEGISAFAYGVTAYAAAMAGSVRGVWATIGLVSGATFVSQVLYGFGTLVLTPNASMSSLPRVAFGTAAYNALLTPLLMPMLRRFTTLEGRPRVQGA